MLLQSWGGSVFLLPALPKAWPRGSVRGLRVRGGASVDLHWEGGRLQQARVHSERAGAINCLTQGRPWTWNWVLAAPGRWASTTTDW